MTDTAKSVSISYIKSTKGIVQLVAVLSVLSIVTGVATLTGAAKINFIADQLPLSATESAGFTGSLTGFLLFLTSYGLRRRWRAAWYVSLFLVPTVTIQGVLQSSVFSTPLVLLSLVVFVILLSKEGVFDRNVTLTDTQIAAGLALVGAQAYGTIGTYSLRNEFRGIDTLLDAFYFTIVTGSTVGYGDATPIPESGFARLYALSVLIVSTATFAVALGTLLTPAIENRFTEALGMTDDAELDQLSDHIIVAGNDQLTAPIIDNLQRDCSILVISDTDAPQSFTESDVLELHGSRTSNETFERARLDTARAVVIATEDDAEDIMTAITVRKQDDDIWIVAAATNNENIEKFRFVGANTIISPALVGGELLAESARTQQDTATEVVQHLQKKQEDNRNH
ncbi:voltage-gated potassium channel [Halorubrum ezzemoulense]|uniref:Voltage-gated potassium channel n=1 Tax=Halorubrum ezzemoulense TaxID=337243 RepID=A0A238Z729_HALEZ|nr:MULTISPECIES: NAD-binding protein [Halorubrum]MDB2239484.1 NAD-binding protein [Halorubrum ezzemoulense]MDB2249878.1 NAD-binding protein [Halorubrum ezzemoulense]MDB2253378.1 NAD-binding protein [Halorubrum ezzemoulense]TKX74990.1 potassium channel protein [Halorubrum sp. GN11_10-6_MGM]SNR79255.1 voltage-gated potassium channel [Halorubrum ezzemoulense]